MQTEDKKLFWGVGIRILLLAVLAIVVLGGVGFLMQSGQRIGGTIVEREVFEQSYQYTAAQRERIATYEAQLAELESQLNDPDLDPATRRNLEAQRAAVRVQLNTARRVDQ